MKRMIVSAAAILLLTAPGAFAQAAMSPAPGGTTMKSTAADAADMKANASAAAAKPKAHHRIAKNEAALNASEAQTTKQLNQEQSQLASNSGGGMASGNPAP